MDTIFNHLQATIPMFVSIMSVVMFKPKARWLSYAVIALAIIAELISLTINVTAVLATISCFIGLLVTEYLQKHKLEKLFRRTADMPNNSIVKQGQFS